MQYLIRFLKILFDEYKKENVILWSSFLTYLTVLNIVPFLYFIIFISSHIPFVKSKIPVIKSTIIDIVPAYSYEILGYFNLFLENISRLELINTVILSFSIISLMGAFFSFANQVYKKKRNIFRLMFSLIFAFILVGFVVSVMIAAKIVLPLFLPQFANALYTKLLPLFVWFIAILAIFYILKDKGISFKYVLLSSALTTVSIFILKFLLGIYFELFTYSKVYGVVAIVPAILLWLFLFWNIILLGIVLPKSFKRLNT